MNRDITIGALLVSVFGAIALVLLVGGCGAESSRMAQRALSATAVSVQQVDQRMPPVIAEAAAAARAASVELDTLDAAMAEYDRRMLPFERATRALEEARSTLRVLQHALSMWKRSRHAKIGWYDAVACGLPVLAELAEALQRAGIDVPPELDRAMRLLLAFVGGTCEPEAA